MKKNSFLKALPYVISSVIGGTAILSTINPEFKENLKKNLDNINMTTIENTIDNIEKTAKYEELKDLSIDKYKELTDIFKKEEPKEIVETDSTYNVFPSSETVIEENPETVIEEIPEEKVIEEPVQEEVIYDEYTDSYLLDNGYEFKEVDANQYNTENSDYVGYIDIPGTTIDYPVYQRENDETNDYYLHRNSEGKTNAEGSIYVDTKVDLSLGDDSSTIQNRTIPIFGHNMGDWRRVKMFNNLKYFKDQSFVDEHPYGVYYSEDGSVYALEIVAGYLTSGETDENILVYNLDNEANFNIYKQFIEENAKIKTDVELEYGDKIVNLVTCSYEKDNYRFVLTCKAVKQYTNENQITNGEEKVRKLTK